MKTLKQYMEENKVTGVELSKFLGCGLSTVYNWACGAMRPSMSHWNQLVELLGITEPVDTLFPKQAGMRRRGEYAVPPTRSAQRDYNILAEARAAVPITNIDLAKKMGVQSGKVFQWLHGRCTVPQNYAVILAKELQLDVSDFYELWAKARAAYNLMMSEYHRKLRAIQKTHAEVQKKDIESLPVSLPKPPPPKTGVFVLIIKADNSYFAAGEWMTVKVFKTRRNALVFAKDHMAKWVVDDSSIYQPVFEALEKKGSVRFNAVSYCIYENTVD